MGAVHNTIENLLNEHDVARIIGLSVASVRRWRLLRQGPTYIKIGAAVRYKPEAIAAWLDSRPTGGQPSSAAHVESAECSRGEVGRRVQRKGVAL
jgi:predicted DNA-binding transcriptional regulator AlpA